MIVKLMLEKGNEMLIDNVEHIMTLNQNERKDFIVCDDEQYVDSHIIDDHDKNADNSIDAVKLKLITIQKRIIYIYSDFNVYIMNDGGKTIQSYYPVYND